MQKWSPILLLFLMACQSPQEKALEEIDELNERLVHATTLEVNREVAEELVEAYIDYAALYSDSSTLADHYMRLGDLYANALNHPVKGLYYFEKVAEDFPTYEKAAVALFYQGYIFENHLQKEEQAKAIYEQFLAQHPNHELVETVRLSINQLGIPLEELIKQFEANQK